MTEAGAERPKLRTSQIVTRSAVGVAIAFIIAMWIYAFGGFASRQAAAKIEDRAWAKRAEQICVQRNDLLGKNADEIRKTTDGSPQAVGKGVKAASVRGAVISESIAAAGTVKLKIEAKGKQKKKLQQRGQVKLDVAVTYTPTGGDPRTQSRNMRLKLK